MKFVKLFFVILFFTAVCVIGFFTLGNNEKVSQLEARNLETFSIPSVEHLLDGSWESSTNEAFSDQLQFRDFFVSAYYKITFKSYSGDVVEGSNNQLYASQQKIDDWDKYEKQLISIANTMNTIADELSKNGTKFIFVSVPRKDAVIQNYLPKYYTSSDAVYTRAMSVLEEHFNENVIVIDAYKVFKNSPTQGYDCYFSTDHHITFYGGMQIYTDIMSRISEDFKDVDVLEVDDYNVSSVTVNGSFNRLIGNKTVAKPEPLVISLKNKNFTYERTESGKKSQKQIWGTNVNTYAGAYMDDDNEETIVTTSNETYPNILITGASFTNIMETLLVPSCHVMASVDYRYNDTGKSLLQYAKQTDADYVIYIPSQSNNALSISKMKQHLGIK